MKNVTPRPKRIFFTVAVEKGTDKLKAIVAAHGTSLPDSDNPDIRVAKLEETEGAALASMISVAIYKGMHTEGLVEIQRDGDDEGGDE
jgi:hypothetical protein